MAEKVECQASESSRVVLYRVVSTVRYVVLSLEPQQILNLTQHRERVLTRFILWMLHTQLDKDF